MTSRRVGLTAALFLAVGQSPPCTRDHPPVER